LEVVGAVETDAAGRAVKLYGASLDITEAKQAEAQLRQHRHFIERIADTTPNLLYIYDLKQNRNVYANRELFRQLGYTSEGVQQTGAAFLPQVVHPDDFPEVLRSFRDLAAAGDTDIVQVEYRIRTAAGDWRWFYDRATVFSRDPDGSARQALGTSQDITEQKRSQQALHEKNEQLSQALAEAARRPRFAPAPQNALSRRWPNVPANWPPAKRNSARPSPGPLPSIKDSATGKTSWPASSTRRRLSTWIADAGGTQDPGEPGLLDLFGVRKTPSLGWASTTFPADQHAAEQPFYKGPIEAVFTGRASVAASRWTTT
jgi:PAS domain S-box-containing protein